MSTPLLKKDELIIFMNLKTDMFSSSLCKVIIIIINNNTVKGYKNKTWKTEKLNLDWLYQDIMIKIQLILLQKVSLFNSFAWEYVLNSPFF